MLGRVLKITPKLYVHLFKMKLMQDSLLTFQGAFQNPSSSTQGEPWVKLGVVIASGRSPARD
jgi:hypothetical protein